MNRVARCLIMVFNSFALAACSSYETAAIPTDPAAEVEADSKTPALRAGMEVRIHLLPGDVVEGEVIAVAESHVTVGNPSNHGYVETTCAFEDIKTCEVLTAPLATRLLAFSMGLLVVAFIVFGYGIRNIGEGWEHL